MDIDGNTAVHRSQAVEGRGSRKEAGKLVRGKSTFRIWESSRRKLGRKSSVARKNEGNKAERSNYRIKIQKNYARHFRLE